MGFEVRSCATVEEFKEAVNAIGQYFQAPSSDEDFDRLMTNIELARMHAAFDSGSVVGGAGAYSFDLSVPGGSVPAAGVTIVGVYPTHRRRGVLREMMRTQLDDVHRKGEPLAVLWASEEVIYGRFGYGLSSFAGEISIPHEYGGFDGLHVRSGSIRFVDKDDAFELCAPAWEKVRLDQPGMPARTVNWWKNRILYDPEGHRQGSGPKRIVVFERNGSIEGYAIFGVKASWKEGSATSELNVREALGTTPEAIASIWRFLLDIDLKATVKGFLIQPDHPLFLLLSYPRRARYRMGDGIWMRLVDVGAALSARSYNGDGEIVFEVRDEFCPWNAGRWMLSGGEAVRTDAGADIALNVSSLGSAYLGGVSFERLAVAQRLEELKPGAVARADELFRTRKLPWCPEMF